MMISKSCLPLSLHLYHPILILLVKNKRLLKKLLNLLKKRAKIWNSILIRNANYLISKMDVGQNDVEWIGRNKKGLMSWDIKWHINLLQIMLIRMFPFHLKLELWFRLFVLWLPYINFSLHVKNFIWSFIVRKDTINIARSEKQL